jgi:hypothetical protein
MKDILGLRKQMNQHSDEPPKTAYETDLSKPIFIRELPRRKYNKMFADDPKLEEAKALLATYMQSNQVAEWQKAETQLLDLLVEILEIEGDTKEAMRLILRVMYDSMMMEGVEAHAQALMGKLIDRLST